MHECRFTLYSFQGAIPFAVFTADFSLYTAFAPASTGIFFRLPPVGGDNEIRTHDPLLARQVLSQLSYTPTTSSDGSRQIVFSLQISLLSSHLLSRFIMPGDTHQNVPCPFMDLQK